MSEYTIMNFLVFNTTPTHVEVALYENATCLELRAENYKQSSAQLLRHLHELLTAHNKSLAHISFIAANAGPGPCTTLRTVLSLVNGLGYATKVPLVAVNGVEAFVREHYNPTYTHTFALFNAFCSDVFFARHDYATDTIQVSCLPISDWLQELKQFLATYPLARIQFIGNGYLLHHAAFTQLIGADIINPATLPLSASHAAIAQIALELWKQKKTTPQIEAVYFKAYLPHKS